MEIQSKIKVLISFLEDKPFNINKFDDMLANIHNQYGDDSIVPLMDVFQENFEYDEAMFSLIHTVEATSDDAYIYHMIEGMSLLRLQSLRWSSILMMRILNSPKTVRVALKYLPDAKNMYKSSWKDILLKINDVSPEFQGKTAPLLSIL